MVFTMNGTAAPVGLEGRTIGDILAELDERAEAMGDIIVEVRLDGTSLSPDEIAEASDRAASAPGSIELVAEPASDLKSRGLESLLSLVRAAGEAMGLGDESAIAAARDAWESYRSAFGGLFSAEEASFVDAFGERLRQAGPASDIGPLADSMIAFFGERLSELRDPAAAMLAASRVFDAIKDELSEVPVRLQTGKDAQAMRTMVLAVELINKTVRIMPEFARTALESKLEVGGATVPEFYAALNDVLRELAQAFESKDGVLIGDLAEYEIRPRLESFFTAVKTASAAL